MKGPFYEVAAVTPYTERPVQDKNDGKLLKSRRIAPPINALFLPAQTTDANLTCHSSGGHISSDGSSSVQTVINARCHGPESSATDLSGTQSSSEGICSSCNDTARQIIPLTQSTNNACEIFTEANADNDVDNELKSTDGYTFDISEVERLRNEALKESLALWQGKHGSTTQETFRNSAKSSEVLPFAQPTETTSCTSESLGSWIESSISQRESSISSSWWGGSSVSTGVSLESDMDDCPLLASTMLDVEQKFSSEAEILEAIQRANKLAEDESPAATDQLETENKSGSKPCFTEILEFLELDKDSNYNFNDFSTEPEKKTYENEINETESENGTFFTKNQMNFLELKKDDFPQQVEEKIKFVANQLYVLEKSNVTNSDSPMTKSYRDVLLSAPSTTKPCLNKSKMYLNKTDLPPLSNINSVTLKENTYPCEKATAMLPEKSNNFLEWWMPNIELNAKQSEAVILSDKVGEKMDSFYSAHSSVCQSMSDGSLTSGSESGTELYRTALSRLQDSGDESGTLSDFTKSSSEMTTSEDSDNHSSLKENIASCNVHKTFGEDVENGNFADFECSYETSFIRRDLVPSHDGSARSRKRQRIIHKQAQNGYSSCSSDTDAPYSKYAAYPEKHIAIVTREQVCDSSALSSSDDCSSARSSMSSDENKDKMSASRDSSSSSRSSSKSSSTSSDQSERVMRRLNPDCPPFVPRAARRQTLSSTNSSVSGADDKEILQEGPCRQNFGDAEKCSDKKALDTSLMPPPSSTKVLGGGNPQLRLSSSFPADSGIDTTGQYNTSVNMTQGARGHSSAVQVLDDSAFPDVHVADTLEDSVFFKSSFTKQFEADKMMQSVTDTKDLDSRVDTRQTCIMKDPTSTDMVFTNKPDNTSVHDDPNREEIELCFKASDMVDLLEPSPYKCDVQHYSDFIPIEDVYSHYRLKGGGKGLFPRFNLTPINLNTIMSLSQRVVRLRVKKPLASYASSNFKFHHHGQEKVDGGPAYDHYGTGFVFNINSHYFEIRTHEAVVGNAEEAARTEVTFDLIISGSRHMFEVSDSAENGTTERGERTDSEGVNFISNAPHSQVTTFRRSTPAKLVPWLHMFPPVPVKVRTSLFEDSCYFSDSSPDCSLVEPSGSSRKLQDVQAIKRPYGGHEVSLKKSPNDIQTYNAYHLLNSEDGMSASRQNTSRNISSCKQVSGNFAYAEYIQENNSSPSSSKAQDSNDLCDSMSDEAFSWDNMVQETKDMDAGMIRWQGNIGKLSNAFGSFSGISGDTNDKARSSKSNVNKSSLICTTGDSDTSNCCNGCVESSHRLRETRRLFPCNTISGNPNNTGVTYSQGKHCLNVENSRTSNADTGTNSDRVDQSDKWKAENYCCDSGSEHCSFQSLYQSQLRQGIDLGGNSIRLSQNCASGNITFQSCGEYVEEEPTSVCRQSTLSGGSHCMARSKDVLQQKTFQDEENRSSGEQSVTNEQQKHILNGSSSYRYRADNVKDKICDNNNCPSIASLLAGRQGSEQVVDEAASSVGLTGSERAVRRGGRSNAPTTYKYEATQIERQGNRKERISSCPLTPGGPTCRNLNRGQRVKGLGDDTRPPSPLVIMERRAASEGQATLSGVGQCPYKGVDIFGQSGAFTPFSSYAGN